MPITADKRAYVQCNILFMNVEDNKQQISDCLRAFIGLHFHFPPDARTPGPFLSISPT